MVAVDLYLPAMSAISEELGSNHRKMQLTINIYMLSIGVGQLLAGPIIDHYGRRHILLFSLIVYCLGSLGCAMTTSDIFLIIMRIVQAFGASTGLVISFSATRDIENLELRARALAYISIAASISPILAPIVGAYLLSHLGWRSIFAFMTLLGIIVLPFAFRYLKESPHLDPDTKVRFFKPYGEIIRNKEILYFGALSILAFTAIMIFISNSSYLFIDKLSVSPKVFSFLFAINASTIIFGNYVGINLRKILSIKNSLSFGALCILFSSIILGIVILIASKQVIAYLLPIMLMSLGVILILPTTSAAAIKPFTKKASTASALLNSCRLSISGIFAGLVGIFYVRWPISLALSFFIIAILILLLLQRRSCSLEQR